MEYYHGTYVAALPSIMEMALRPTLGAGSDVLHTHFGCMVLGVYMAKSWRVASSYPMSCTTSAVPENKCGVNGGTLIARDGTPPLRVVV